MTTSVSAPGVGDAGRRRVAGLVGRRLLDAGLLIFLATAIIAFSLLSPYFLSVRNFMNILLSVAIVGIVGGGMTLVVIAGGIDLSCAATMALAGSIEAGLVMQQGHPWYIGLLAGLFVGVVIGLLNGAIITRLKIMPIIVTLGTSSIARGAAYIYTEGNTVFVQNQGLEWAGVGRILGVPVPVVLMLLTFVGLWGVLRFTVFGRYVYSIGGNPVASRLAGISVDRYTLAVFVFSGLMAGLAGIVLVGLTATAMPSVATGYELDVVTAVLLGGASLRGGEGSIWGTLIGVLIIGIINNGMALLNVPPYWQILAKGVLLLGAVALDALRKR